MGKFFIKNSERVQFDQRSAISLNRILTLSNIYSRILSEVSPRYFLVLFRDTTRGNFQEVLFKEAVEKIYSKAICKANSLKAHFGMDVLLPFCCIYVLKTILLRTPLGAACAVSKNFGKITSL